MDDLLRPVLSSDESARSIYSSKALFLTAFFLGPNAAIILSAFNSRILGRLAKDLILYFLAILIYIAFLYLIIKIPDGTVGYEWLSEYRRENPVYRYGPRFLALVFWSISYALHRKYHKAMNLMGVTPVRPWGAVAVCLIAGIVLDLCIVSSILKVNGVL